MTSLTANTEGSIVSADSINYEQKMYSHPSYKLDPQFPNTFGQSIVLGSSQVPVTINIPPEVFNLAESYLSFAVYIPQGLANTYTWCHSQAISSISHIQLYSGSGMWIADIDNLQNYLDITLKKELSQNEFLSLDNLTGVSQSNSVVNVVPALRNANVAISNVAALAANQSNINYMEPGYLTVGAVSGAGVAGSQELLYQFPLRLIKNSVFSVNKNLYFGQTTYMKIYFGPTSKICYSSTSNASPSAGTKTSYTPLTTATAGFTLPVINDLQLILAVESNQDLRTKIINQVSSSGLSYLIPYVQAFKNSNSGGSQNISIQLDQGNGRSLMKVYHAPYNSFEDMDCAYDHSNYGYVSGAYSIALNQKCQQYYTQLNGKRNQDLTLDCTDATSTPYSDYMSHRRQLRGSILMNHDIYQYNWFHCDDWTGFNSRQDQDNTGELISGIPMSVAPLTWSFVGTVMRPLLNTFQHYSWFVFIKKLTMAPGQVMVE